MQKAILLAEPTSVLDVTIMLAAAFDHAGIIDDALKDAHQEEGLSEDLLDDLRWGKRHAHPLYSGLAAMLGKMIRHCRADIDPAFVAAFCGVDENGQAGHGPALDELPDPDRLKVPAA